MICPKDSLICLCEIIIWGFAESVYYLFLTVGVINLKVILRNFLVIKYGEVAPLHSKKKSSETLSAFETWGPDLREVSPHDTWDVPVETTFISSILQLEAFQAIYIWEFQVMYQDINPVPPLLCWCSFCNQMGMFCHYTSNVGCFSGKAKTKSRSTEMYKVKVCTIAFLNFSIRLSHMCPNFCALYICSHINKCTQFYLQLTLFSVLRCF